VSDYDEKVSDENVRAIGALDHLEDVADDE